MTDQTLPHPKFSDPTEESEYFFKLSGLREPLSFDVWSQKYRLVRAGGATDEFVPADTHRRVAHALYENDPRRGEFLPRVIADMNAYRYIPGGRILAGAGAGRNVTLLNCYVGGTIEDSMPGIMTALTESALTLQQGGGIGNDFSTLRPKDALVMRTESGSSGPLSFMNMWDSMSATIESAGARRGAMMATLADWHPDLPAFIAAKQKPGALRMFNFSILVSDAFIEAVKNNLSWDLGFPVTHKNGQHATVLDEWPVHVPKQWTEYRAKGAKWYVYRRLPARELWNAILESTYRYAEPGVIFIDRVNHWNPLNYCEEIRSTNPCAEQPMPPWNSCNLGSINASRFIRDPFTKDAALPEKTFTETISRAVRTHDNVIDASLYPLPQQREQALLKRRIGLGFTGVANALQKLRLRYGSPDAVAACEKMARGLRDAAYRASIDLAKERGPFPAFDREKYLATPWAKTLPEDIREGIFEHGIRNGVLLDIAPTGTTSTQADNVSSGIEPTFSFAYVRNLTQPDGSRIPVKALDAGLRDYIEAHGEPEWDGHGNPIGLPDYMVTAQNLTVEQHLDVTAAFQKYIDASISKTINCPESMSFDSFKAVYDLAYTLGCKGCTTYRPDPAGLKVRGAILETLGPSTAPQRAVDPTAEDGKSQKKGGSTAPDNQDNPAWTVTPLPLAANAKRPHTLNGSTYKIPWTTGNIYVTVNDALVDGAARPYEMFINHTTAADAELTSVIAITGSAILRSSQDPTFLIEHLRQVHSADGGCWIDGKLVPSRAAAIADILKEHFLSHGLVDTNGDRVEKTPAATTPRPKLAPVLERGTTNATPKLTVAATTCPKCGGSKTLIHEEGCQRCLNCNYEKCS